MRVSVLIIMTCIFAGCAVTSTTFDETHFKKTVVIRDDPSQNTVTFSTVKGFQNKQATTGQVWNDNFLRGFVDKNTGEKTYQVYNVIYYGGSGTKASWKHFKQANYDTLRGIKLTPTTLLKENENCTSLAVYGQCVYNEHVAFRLDNQLFRTIATLYKSESARKWQYTLISESGESYEDVITIAEMAGLLASMDEYELPKTVSDKTSTGIVDLSNLPEPFVISPPLDAVLKLQK